MNFGDDDPLAGILSDDNDSFFEEPKVITRKSSLQKPSEKKITDLFNLGETPKENKLKNTDWLGIDDTAKETFDISKSPKKAKPVKKISFEDDDDILGTLGLNKKSSEKPQLKIDDDNKKTEFGEKKAKKTDLFESILKPSRDSRNSFEDLLKDSKQSVATRTVESKAPIEGFGILDGSREGRRRRATSTGLIDPLGLFTSESKKEEKIDNELMYQESTTTAETIKTEELFANVQIKDSKSVPDLPDWLGGSSSKSKTEGDGATSTTTIKPKSEGNLGEISETIEDQTHDSKTRLAPEHENMSSTAIHTIDNSQMMGPLFAQQKLAQSQMEYQNTAITLQQQESHILMALQMKKYEENLTDMQRQQQEILFKQEQQFGALLERQFAKQQAIENNMRMQQDRINSHIQLLIAQPNVAIHPSQEEVEKAKLSAEEEHVKLYENMISNMKQRQHEETFLLEESYKKQMSLLEKSMESMETRLNQQMMAIAERYEENAKQLQNNHEIEIDRFKRKLENIESQHILEIDQMREAQKRVVDEINYEHNVIVDNMKQSKQSEHQLFSESTTFVQKLDTNIDMLCSNSQILQHVAGRIEKDYSGLRIAREESLKAKEKEIEMMKATLEKCRESAEAERSQLLGLVRSLETKIAEQNQNSREERWALQQAASTLAARASAFDREMEFSRTAMERERDQLKTLRESLLAEQDKVILQLTEEKLSITAERSRLETSSKLNVSYDAQRTKAEVDVAIEVAKEAAAMADRERDTLYKQQCEVESIKRILQDKERKLASREAELVRLAQIAEHKSRDGEKAIQEAQLLDVRVNDRMKELQYQLAQLSNREKKLTEEKISLSKERLALNMALRKTRQCGLCAVHPTRLEDPQGGWNSDFKDDHDLPEQFNLMDTNKFRIESDENEDSQNIGFVNEEFPRL